MTYTPTPLPRKASSEQISQTTNINFALLQSTIKTLEDQIKVLQQGTKKKRSSVFSDGLFRVQDNLDPTKQIALEAEDIATATTRTIKMPDYDINLGAMGLITGILSGLDVTINGGDPAKFDVSAGTGIIIDWIVPTAPVFTPVTYAGATAVTITDIGTTQFTSLHIDINGDLIQLAATPTTPQLRRQNIILDAVVHSDNLTITSLSVSGVPAQQSASALLDYVRRLGPLNSGNAVSAASTNLTIQKAAGSTTLPFINKNNDNQNPTEEASAAENPISSWSAFYRDGSGGITVLPAETEIDPDFYDDGSGTLAAMNNNKWQIQRLYFFGQTNRFALTYGQAQYLNLDTARANIFVENPVINPLFSAGKFVTALLVEKGATDLSDPTTAEFLDIVSITSAPGSGSQTLQDVYNISGASPQLIMTLGKLGFKSGGTDTDDVIEILNAAGTQTLALKGNGTILYNNNELIEVFQSLKNSTTQTISTQATLIGWQTAIGKNGGTAPCTINSGTGEVTLDKTGWYDISFWCRGFVSNANPSQISIRMFQDTGGGFAAKVGASDDQFNRFDTTQTSGTGQFHGFVQSYTAGDKILFKIEAIGQAFDVTNNQARISIKYYGV